MASVTLTSVADTWPPGTSVGAYPQSNWLTSEIPPSGAAKGSSTEAKTVASDGSLAFLSLAANTRYYVGASVSGTWKYRTVDTTSVDSTPVEGTGSGLPSAVFTKTANYTASAGEFILADASGGAFQVTLPAGNVGDLITVKKVDATAAAVAVDVTAGGTIDGDSDGASITAPQFGVILECTSPGVWKIVAPTSAAVGGGTTVTVDGIEVDPLEITTDLSTEAATIRTEIGAMANPMTTAGDIIYGGVSGAPTRLAKGANNTVLSVDGSGVLGFAAGGGSTLAAADGGSASSTYGAAEFIDGGTA